MYMEKNLDLIASELFGKIRTQFPKIQLGDAEGKITDVPESARFFEFDFVVGGNPLGTVSVSLSEQDGVVVMYSNSIVDDVSPVIKDKWFTFLQSLRGFAKQSLLNFDTRDIAKTNLEKRDYKQLSKKYGEGQMSESKLWGTAKTSYQNMGESRLIVKHTQAVGEDIQAGSRARHIDSIYIENAEGERFKYPYKHLNGARAMARHVANGGTPYDPIGQYVVGLSEELSKLRMFKGYVDRNPTISEATGSIQSKVLERIDTVKKEIHGLQSQRYYQGFAENFQVSENREIPEDVLNDWVDRLTIRTFNEELKNVFPYIYKLVDESDMPIKGLNPDQLMAELTSNDIAETNHQTRVSVEDQYENILSNIIGESAAGLLSDDPAAQEQAVEQLNQLISQPIPVGQDGTNASESLAGIIDDSELFDIFKELADIDAEFDVRPIVKDYIRIKDEERGTDLLSQLSFDAEQAPAEPAAPSAPAEPAPEQVPAQAPAAPQESRFAEAVKKAISAGLTMEDTFSIAGKDLTLKDAIEQAGYQMSDFVDEPSDELTEYIKSMFDKETGNFPKGQTGVLLAVEKKFGGDAVRRAEQTIESLVSMTEGYRLKRLAGLI